VYSLNPTKLQKNEGMLIDGAVGLQLGTRIKGLKEKLNKEKGWTLGNQEAIKESCLYKEVMPRDPAKEEFKTGLKIKDGHVYMNIFR
jgi:hypothetical protein